MGVKFKMPKVLENLVGGNWVASESERTATIVSPATETPLWDVPLSTKNEVRLAAETAQHAFVDWSKTPVQKRARILFRFQQLLVDEWSNLAREISLENGKTFKEAYAEVQRGIECVEFAASAPTLLQGSMLPDVAHGVETAMYRYPLGVVGGITPFNFPVMVPCWMFPLAIACGNTFILKPSEQTPYMANRLAELLMKAGLPDGVFNVVHGGKDVVQEMIADPTIKAISFVGSQPVAELVHREASMRGKRVQALGGAKNHTIVMPDADLDLAVKSIVDSAFGQAGERCMACSVVIAVGEIEEELKRRLASAADQLQIGDGLQDGVEMGPLISRQRKAATLGYIESGIAEGAELLRDGRLDPAASKEGCYLGPTIFDQVTTDMRIWKEEIFAPVLCFMSVATLKDAIKIANQSEFANGACLYTKDISTIRTFRDEINAGMIGVNVGVPAPTGLFPFSGYKNSFYGDLHVNGTDGVEFYTRKKVVTSRC